MRTWNQLSLPEKNIFLEKLYYGHLLEKKEREFLWELEVTVWSRPLTEKEIFMAREIIDFVIDAELSSKAVA